MTTITACSICHEPILRGQTVIGDHHAGCQPDVQHLWRRENSPSAFCGDESARPWMPATREESLAVPVCALCHQRVMHESYNLWASEALAQEPMAAEVEAAAEAWEAHSPAEFHEDEGEMCCRECGEAFDWIPLSATRFDARRRSHRFHAALIAARDARRDEEKR